jgi:hypothetical protein
VKDRRVRDMVTSFQRNHSSRYLDVHHPGGASDPFRTPDIVALCPACAGSRSGGIRPLTDMLLTHVPLPLDYGSKC